MFKSILSRVLPDKRRYDPFAVSRDFAAFNAVLRVNDFDGAIEFFEALTAERRTLLVDAIADIVRDDGFFDAWCNEGRGPPLAQVLRGALLVRRAWFYRGAGRGYEVSDESADQMSQALDGAVGSLRPIVEHAEYGHEASARLIRAAKGLNANWEDIDWLHGLMRQRGPANLQGEVEYLLASCEKWLGSHEKMFQHVQETIAYYPKVPHIYALIAAAHWERHMHYDRFDEDHEAALAYRTNEKVLAELHRASRRLLDASEPGNQAHILAHNLFACTFSEFGYPELAKPHFELIGEQLTLHPWRFFDDHFVQSAYNRAMRAK